LIITDIYKKATQSEETQSNRHFGLNIC